MDGIGTGVTTLTLTPKNPKADTKYALDGAEHDMVFDGRFEDTVQQRHMNPEAAIKDIQELKKLFEDPALKQARTTALEKNDPFDFTQVTVGADSHWGIGTPVFPTKGSEGVVQLTNPLAQQIIKVKDNFVSITGPTLDNKISQTLVGQYDPKTGTLTCIKEELQVADNG